VGKAAWRAATLNPVAVRVRRNAEDIGGVFLAGSAYQSAEIGVGGVGLAGGLEFEGLDDGTGFQEDEAGREALGEGEVARGDDEGEAAATEAAEARDERGGGGGIEAGGGFVEEKDGGTAKESQGVCE
jgi:hypothetical protein